MTTFAQTIVPTAFGFFDSDTAFQTEADGMVTFVKRKLGDDVLTVELTKREIWVCFEEACLEYSRLIHEMKITSELTSILGMPTGSVDLTNKYNQRTLEFLMRQAEPYANESFVGGSYDAKLGYFELQPDKQDYNIYSEMMDFQTNLPLFTSLPSGSQGKLKVVEVFHFEPLAAQHYLLNASNVTNFLATSFNYESYVNSTVFYMLPVFEDVLRRGMMETAHRVRRSNYSYTILGSNLRIFPLPSALNFLSGSKMFIKVMPPQDPLNPSMYPSGSTDKSIYGVSGPSNVPLGNIPFNSITQPGRQWIRQYTLANCKELLGLNRSKLKNIPIPNADLQLNGEDLVAQGREDKEKLITHLKEFLANLTSQKLLETDAAAAENLNRQLKYVPMPVGKGIVVG